MPRRFRNRSLRSQVLAASLAVVVLALVLFAVPLAWLVARSFHDQQVAALEQEATRVLALLPDSESGKAVRLPAPTDPDVSLGLYGPAGTLIAGSGPTTDDDAQGTYATGVSRTVDEGSALAVYVPLRPEGGTAITVRAASSAAALRRRTFVAWTSLGGLALLVLAVAGAVAMRRARTLSRPFEQLAAAARDLGHGAFALRVPHTGVREAEDVARALEASAARLDERVRRERRFAVDASHQLRTPVTAARLTLESAALGPGPAAPVDAVTTALEQLDRLEQTIDDLLTAGRGGSAGESCAVAAEVADLARRWRPLVEHRRRRVLRVAIERDLPDVVVSSAAVRQVLDVLLDNAVRHGRGTVSVTARDLAGSVALDVRDEGGVPADAVAGIFERGHSTTGGTGIGLALARDLAEAEGARLLLTTAGPPTTFTVVLPAAAEAVHQAVGGGERP